MNTRSSTVHGSAARPRHRRPRHARRSSLAGLLARWCLVACQAWTPSVPAQPYPPVREQIRLDLTIAASDEVNPDDKGRAAPIMVRLYELRSAAVFESADYFSLQAGDKTVLGGDLLMRDEFILRPGETRTIRRRSHPEVGAIAVLAGYRDLGTADWRAVHVVEPAPEAAWYRVAWPAPRARLRIALQGGGVQITPLE
jgi:type VI secretion system protein VasD